MFKYLNSKRFQSFIRTLNIFDETFGLSHHTAFEHNPADSDCTGCVTYPETDRPSHCIECSQALAAIHLPAVNKYWYNITEVAQEKCFPAAIIAAIISRETSGGVENLGADGWWRCQNDHFYNGHFIECFGIMHLPEGKYLEGDEKFDDAIFSFWREIISKTIH